MPSTPPRIARLRAAMKEKSLDAFVVMDRVNSRYLTGFQSSYSILVVDDSSARFVTDSRYAEAAGKALPDFGVLIQPRTKVQEYLREQFGKSGYERMGFEGSITVDQLDAMKKWSRGAKLVKAGETVTDLRAVKDAAELKIIRRATKLADAMMAQALASLKVGAREDDISRGIRNSSEELGGEGESFPCIVASGANSSRPHHHGGARKLKRGDVVTVDLGGIVDGYCSDLTRTVALGAASKTFQRIYEVCLAANEAAIAKLRPGMTGVEVDQIARQVIENAGYGEYFGHGLGHGVGLEIHEAPTLSPRATDYKLRPGNIVTIEPGIYIPGDCGVRIEDYAVITARGCEVLSRAPKQLQVLSI
ncbi:Xaa-Pro peptidase family protein [soil metagenome]